MIRSAADAAKAGHVYFRKTMHLAEVPAEATAVVTCDNSFTLLPQRPEGRLGQ